MSTRYPDPGRPENQVPLLYDGPWYAEVTKVGRWRYEITFADGSEPLMYDLRPICVWGRTRADNRARVELNKRNRPHHHQPERWTVGRVPPESGGTT